MERYAAGELPGPFEVLAAIDATASAMATLDDASCAVTEDRTLGDIVREVLG